MVNLAACIVAVMLLPAHRLSMHELCSTAKGSVTSPHTVAHFLFVFCNLRFLDEPCNSVYLSVDIFFIPSIQQIFSGNVLQYLPFLKFVPFFLNKEIRNGVPHYSFVHLAVCLTTGPKPLPKRALHIARSRASSFK